MEQQIAYIPLTDIRAAQINHESDKYDFLVLVLDLVSAKKEIKVEFKKEVTLDKAKDALRKVMSLKSRRPESHVEFTFEIGVCVIVDRIALFDTNTNSYNTIIS